MVTFNCQNLRKHVSDLRDPVIDPSNILYLLQTWLNDDENVDIPNFNYIAKFMRKSVRSAGMTMYQKSNDASNTVTSKMDILLRYFRQIGTSQLSIGDKQGTQQLETWPGCEATQEESIRTGPASVVANGAALAREMKLTPRGGKTVT
ncbi:ATP-dependent DNA helicase [Trichonephila clavipes]|nr:ATP-dependent DNA helicase [Trichonephila clavipes]